MNDIRLKNTPVEICISDDGRLWVNTVEGCVLRIQGISEVLMDDQRKDIIDESKT